MRWGVAGCAAIASLGCGRIGFDSTGGVDAPHSDAPLDGPPAPIGFVQVQGANTQSTTTASVVMPGQQAHDLTVLVIAYSLSQTITSVTDTAGNTYAVAAPGLDFPSTGQQAIYYAADLAPAASNTITVTLVGTSQVDLVALEYAGLSPTPLDTTAAATGNSAVADSGPLSTSFGHELLLASALLGGNTYTPDPTFTLRADLGTYVEDRVTDPAGTYNATVNLTPAAGWVVQLVAFHGM